MLPFAAMAYVPGPAGVGPRRAGAAARAGGLARRPRRRRGGARSAPASAGSRWSAGEGARSATVPQRLRRGGRQPAAALDAGDRHDRQRPGLGRVLGPVLRRVGSARGWDVDRVLLLLAVLTTAGGLALGLLANARRIGAWPSRAGSTPCSRCPCRRCPTCCAADRAHPPRRPRVRRRALRRRRRSDAGADCRVLVVVLASAALLTGFLVLTGSLAFFVGRSESGDLGFHTILMLGAYPVDVFVGRPRVMLSTVVPAAFVAAGPGAADRRLRRRAAPSPWRWPRPCSPSPGWAPSPSACAATRRARVWTRA